MRLLSIETSCDETALSIVEVTGEPGTPSFRILANIVRSQIEMHREFGGVFPTVAKREHAKNLPPIFVECLKQAEMFSVRGPTSTPRGRTSDDVIRTLLERESDMAEEILNIADEIERPAFDAIAVTTGPGLEPALWVGINFAKALSMMWDIPVMPVNHMEGHALSILVDAGTDAQEIQLPQFAFPALALLISGGHTELVLMRDFLSYEKLGATRDDAVGEAFDKVARLLGLPYPGGPEISRLARDGAARPDIVLPRPMLHSGDYDFSFSGIKTAVLYLLKNFPQLDEQTRCDICREFEIAVTEVLVKKTLRAIEEFGVRTLIVAGGVAGNSFIRSEFEKALVGHDIVSKFPTRDLATDNSLMIAIAGYFSIANKKDFPPLESIRADSNWSL